MTRLYRLLTEDDTSAFCHKVSRALADGWTLHGDPVMSFDAARGVMRCGQAVIKEVEVAYSPDLKLGEQ
ncbi:MAG: putative conserved small protein [Rhodobacteraceae bacterium HLUCCO18]|nr:MAG: putative conserved small protein [Rhodobacteraceae bacterium HLUCCO18]